jgi:hypothetical protein
MTPEAKHKRLEVGAYIVVFALALPCFFLAEHLGQGGLRDLLINLSATFLGAGFLFFLLNRFFGLEGIGTQPVGYAVKLAYDFEDFSEFIRRASKINAAGVTLSSGSNRYLGLLQEALKRGAAVRILVADPTSPAFSTIASRMGKHDSANELLGEWSQSIANFEKLAKAGGAFELRVLPEVASWGIWEFDPGSKHHAVYAEVYAVHAELDLCISTSNRGDGDLANYFSAEFERLWAASTPRAMLST